MVIVLLPALTFAGLLTALAARRSSRHRHVLAGLAALLVSAAGHVLVLNREPVGLLLVIVGVVLTARIAWSWAVENAGWWPWW